MHRIHFRICCFEFNVRRNRRCRNSYRKRKKSDLVFPDPRTRAAERDAYFRIHTNRQRAAEGSFISNFVYPFHHQPADYRADAVFNLEGIKEAQPDEITGDFLILRYSRAVHRVVECGK